MLVDLVVATLSVAASYAVFPPDEIDVTPHIALWQAFAIFGSAVAISSMVFGLYERETVLSRSRIVVRMLLTTGTAAVLIYALVYVVMYATVSRRVTGLALLLLFSFGVGVRLLAWWAVQRLHRGLLVVGARALFESFEQSQSQGLLSEYRLAGFANSDPSEPLTEADPWYKGAIGGRVAEFVKSGITDIVVSAEAMRDPRLMDWIVSGLQHGCRVTNEAIFYEKATGQILVDQITSAWFLFADLRVHCDRQATLKRAADLFCSLLGLCLTLPLWPIIALAVRLWDRGPAFYAQQRVGQNGKIFTLYKFRTMRIDAENGKSVWAAPDDPRVTPIGRWLRKSRLDELPQLYNILRGDMSLIGPRPERPDLVAELIEKVPFYKERHLVKPGLTGWAQISFRYGSSVEDAKRKLQFDLYYLKHMSFELDIIILFRTVGTFLRGAC
jgi:sugar transferase (PEP-CTERM system associated)